MVDVTSWLYPSSRSKNDGGEHPLTGCELVPVPASPSGEPGRSRAESLSNMPEHVEARSRMLSILSVLEHEGDALAELDTDGNLGPALDAIQTVKAEIIAALASLGIPPQNGGRA